MLLFLFLTDICITKKRRLEKISDEEKKIKKRDYDRKRREQMKVTLSP